MSKLRRPLYPMPDFVKKSLLDKELMYAYLNRPPYQRNDYIGWIIRAKQEKTQQKRLNQMLDELSTGDRYMNMKYTAKSIKQLSSRGSLDDSGVARRIIGRETR